MKGEITICLDEKLEEMLDHACRETGRPREEVARDALRRHLMVHELHRLRKVLVPKAQERGIYTDEDVFRIVS